MIDCKTKNEARWLSIKECCDINIFNDRKKKNLKEK